MAKTTRHTKVSTAPAASDPDLIDGPDWNADHQETYSGLTPGHVLRASGATAADFAAIQDGDIPASIARDSEVTTAVGAEATARDAAIGVHAAAADPHPGYLTPAEGNAAYDAAGAAAAVTTTSIGAVPAARTITTGTGLTGGGDLSANRTLAPDFGTGAGKVTQGNDSRLSDARTPTGAAGGDLGGTYPNPSVTDDSHSHTSATLPAAGADLSGIDFLVGTASGLLSAEIVVGTSPGGELGGTWGSPTVDATHSGSTHAAAQAAAEATAAGALSTHAGASDPHTGYRLESADHSHASTGLQGGTIAYSAITGTPAAERAASSTTPSPVGTAAIGSGVTDAKSDHVHATGAGTPSTQAFGDAAATGSGPAAAMTDHKHAMPALGTGATNAAAGNDSRLSDARTPTAHAASHKAGGSDDLSGVQNGFAPLSSGLLVPVSYLPVGTGSTQVAAGDHTHAGGGGDDPILDIFGTPDDPHEFGTSTIGGTAVGTATVMDAHTTIPNHLYIKKAATASVAVTGNVWSVSPPFTAIAFIADSTPIRADYMRYGMLGITTNSPTSGALEAIELLHVSPTGPRFGGVTYTSPTGSTGAIGTDRVTTETGRFYLAVSASSSTSVNYYVSPNGRVWFRHTSARNPGFTIANVGVFVQPQTASFDAAAAFGFLRIWTSVKTFPFV